MLLTLIIATFQLAFDKLDVLEYISFSHYKNNATAKLHFRSKIQGFFLSHFLHINCSDSRNVTGVMLHCEEDNTQAMQVTEVLQ